MTSIDLNEKLLGVKQVADFLGVSKRHVYNLVDNGTIKKVKLKGIIRIHPRELEKLINE